MARIITKGLIGLEDLNVGSGTFARATSTGGTQTLHQITLSSVSTAFSVSSQNANFTAAVTTLYRVTTGASVITVTLPSAVLSTGQEFVIKKIDSGAGTVQISGTIDGTSGYTLVNQMQYVRLMSNGTDFDITGNN